jgi:type II secretory pathway pseudopilin PulG
MGKQRVNGKAAKVCRKCNKPTRRCVLNRNNGYCTTCAKREGGFTVVECMIIIAIIALLTAIAVAVCCKT